jgi:hypothetical protein
MERQINRASIVGLLGILCMAPSNSKFELTRKPLPTHFRLQVKNTICAGVPTGV